jgi:hypothetical protein
VGEGVSDAHDLPSARAQFEAGCTEAQKAEGNKDRKSQVREGQVAAAACRRWQLHRALRYRVTRRLAGVMSRSMCLPLPAFACCAVDR